MNWACTFRDVETRKKKTNKQFNGKFLVISKNCLSNVYISSIFPRGGPARIFPLHRSRILSSVLFSSAVRSPGQLFLFPSSFRSSPLQPHLVFFPSLLRFSAVLFPPLRLARRARGRTDSLSLSLLSTKKSLSQNGRPYLRDSRADAFPTRPPLSPSVQSERGRKSTARGMDIESERERGRKREKKGGGSEIGKSSGENLGEEEEKGAAQRSAAAAGKASRLREEETSFCIIK